MIYEQTREPALRSNSVGVGVLVGCVCVCERDGKESIRKPFANDKRLMAEETPCAPLALILAPRGTPANSDCEE